MKIAWIEPGVLAAGSIPVSKEDIESIHGQGVSAILSLTENPITTFRTISDRLFENLDLVYHHVPIPDQYGPEPAQIPEILQFFEQMASLKRPVLVHCQAGIGRTGTILHLYYLARGLSLDKARTRVYERRPQCTLLSEYQIAVLEKFVDECHS